MLVSVTALVCGTFRGVAKLTEASTEACGSVPVPVRLTAVGDAGSLLEMDSTPVSGPGMVGANEMVMSQLMPGAIVPAQPLLATPKPAPVVVSEAVTPVTERSALPELVTCTVVLDVLVPTLTLPASTLPGALRVATGAGVPLPVTCTE